VDLEDLEEQLGQTLLDGDERDEVDTLGGLIFTLVDRVPDIGESVHHPVGLTFHILDADPRRIKRVRIEIVDPEERQPRRLAGELLGPGD
jgi:CBS domain containing-hemolysin-like protein